MIGSPGLQLNLQAIADTLSSGEGGGLLAAGGDFLQTLLAALPPETQDMNPEDLLAWLQAHAAELMPVAQAPMPLAAPAGEVVAAAADGEGDAEASSDQDPVALLGALLSARPDGAGLGFTKGQGQGPVQGLAIRPEEAAAQQAALFTGDLGDAAPAPENNGFQNLLHAIAPKSAANEATSALAEPPQWTLRTPVQHPDFPQAVGERLLWMVRQEVQHAKIHLDPAHLGPLDIAVSVKDDQASIVINAHHPHTRELLEAEAPRLKGMLGDSGFSMVDVNVARDQRQHGEERRSGGGRLPNDLIGGEADVESARPARMSAAGLGLVDHYA